ncbi:hypothetical protein [Bacillus pretiosus]|uniref:hypothetical protein n=1 Tax=Bacillus pretiosus TaxID=2983392 RepID=UPI003D65A12E
MKYLVPYNNIQAIGYPKNYGNNQTMYAVNGQKGSISNGKVQMKGNPMRKGNSGGAWIGIESDNSLVYIVGLNSHHITGNDTDEYSPYFDQYVKTLYNCVRDKNCPDS